MRLGLDLGGTKTEAVVLDDAGAIWARRRRPTPVAEGYEAIVQNMAGLVLELEQETGPCSVGVGTPGVSSARGLIKNSNTACLNGRPLEQDLARILKRPIRIANDANCFALSEAQDGAGRGAGVVFGVIMGTGVGGGVVVQQQLWAGRQHIAGEWGHNILETNGPACYCGRRGCVETFLSGPGLSADHSREAGGAPLAPAEIARRAMTGDAEAQATMARFLDRFGRALAMVVNILDPEVIVLGGGLSHLAALYGDGVQALARYVFNDQLLTDIRPNIHGDSAGVRGAARLWPPGHRPGL